MSNSLAIHAADLCKIYRLYQQPWDRIRDAIRPARNGRHHEFWALRNVSLDVSKGCCVGIVGANGSGKSTLLQVLAGTLAPSSGSFEVSGKIGAILELGAGFNPELTGLANLKLNATLLGLDKEETADVIEQAVAFAQIGEYLDQPVKFYSSGMFVRLAFALQTALPKEVLIVDEALAVGDEAFQRRCFAVMEKFRDDGGTVLFVSHAAGLVNELCDSAVMMDQGEVVLRGNSRIVVDHNQRYSHMEADKKAAERQRLLELFSADESADVGWSPAISVGEPVSSQQGIDGLPEDPAVLSFSEKESKKESGSPSLEDLFDEHLVSAHQPMMYSTSFAEILDPHIETLDGNRVNVIRSGENYRIVYETRFHETCRSVLFGTMLKSLTGLELGGAAHEKLGHWISEIASGSRVRVEFQFTCSLYPGTYYFNCGVTGHSGSHDGFLARIVDACAFRVRANVEHNFAGYVNFAFQPLVCPEGHHRSRRLTSAG